MQVILFNKSTSKDTKMIHIQGVKDGERKKPKLFSKISIEEVLT